MFKCDGGGQGLSDAWADESVFNLIKCIFIEMNLICWKMYEKYMN